MNRVYRPDTSMDADFDMAALEQMLFEHEMTRWTITSETYVLLPPPDRKPVE